MNRITLKRLAAPIAAVAAITASITQMGGDLGKIAAFFKASWAGGAILVVLMVWAFAIYWRSRPRRTVGFTLELRPAEADRLVGRDAEIETLEALCQDNDTIHLHGKSGVGKSSLLRGGLLPRLQRTGSFLPVYLDRWDVDWSTGLENQLLHAMLRSRPWASPDVAALLDQASKETGTDVFELLARIHEQAKIPVLLIFDQFERYLVRNVDALRDPKTGALLTFADVCRSNPFWNRVGALDRAACHFLFVVPLEESHGLSATFQIGQTKVKWLPRVGVGDVRDLLRRIAPRDADGKAIGGWDELVDAILSDLTVDDQVLPAELSVALQGVQTLPELSADVYRREGGLKGLKARLIHKAAADTSERCRLTKRDVLSLLVRFVDASSMTSRAVQLSELLSTPEAGESSSGARREITPALADQALSHLDGEWRLVRQRLRAEGAERVWSLTHDYLCTAISSAYGGSAGLVPELQGRLREFRQAPGLLSRWERLLPLRLQFAVWRERLFGRLRLGSYRGYVMVSSLRFLPLGCGFLALFGLADAGIPVPGRTSMQNALDLATMTPFRPVPDLAAIEASRAKLAADTLLALKRATPKTLYEVWSFGQALYARQCDPAVSQAEVHSDLAKVFGATDLLRRSPDHSAYAWQRTPKNAQMFAPPALWIGAAVARAAAAAPADSPSRAELLTWLDETESVSHQFRGPHGEWFFAAGLRKPGLENTYSSVLGLMYDLERVRVGGPGEEGARASAARTFDWLVKVRVQGRTPGWQSFPGPTGLVMRALSLQSYATLLRASNVLGRAPPDELVRDAAGQVLAFEGLTPNDLYKDECVLQEVDEYEGDYLDERGEPHEEELPVSYAWYPWALATGFQLIENPKLSALLTRVQRRRVQRQLGIWVDPRLTGGLEWAKRMSGDNPWAFAETYMGLAHCDGGPRSP